MGHLNDNMRSTITIILLITVLAGVALGYITGNHNEDCIVNLTDYAYLAQGWGTADPNGDLDSSGVVDNNDLDIFAGNWLEFESGEDNPDPNDLTLGITAGSDEYLELEVQNSDPGLIYRILTIPDSDYYTLYDPNNTDAAYSTPDSTDADLIEISSVPYTITDDNGYVLVSAAAGISTTGSFTWDVNDSQAAPCGGLFAGTATLTTGTPLANDANSIFYVNNRAIFGLTATDDGEPNDLSYIVTALPSTGTLFYDTGLTDIVDSVPFTIPDNGQWLYFLADANTTDSITFKANDGAEDSVEATYTFNCAPDPNDRLGYTNGNYAEIPDSDTVDLEDGTVVMFYFRTRQRIATLCQKRDSDSGYELLLVGGRLRLNLYSGGRMVHSLWSPADASNIANGDWVQVAFCYKNDDTDVLQDLSLQGSMLNYGVFEGFDAGSHCGDFDLTNDANMVFVPAESNTNRYRGDVDRIKIYKAQEPFSLNIATGLIEERNIVGNGIFAPTPTARWMCDEGSGETITDDKLSIAGTYTDPNWSSLGAEVAPVKIHWRKAFK